MVNPHDPFTPRKVFRRFAEAREFPVEEPGESPTIDNHILRPEVPMDDHRTRSMQVGDRIDRHSMQISHHTPQKGENFLSTSTVDQVLSWDSRNRSQEDRSVLLVEVEEFRYRKTTAKMAQALDLDP